MLTASRFAFLVILSLLLAAGTGGMCLPVGGRYAPTAEPALALSLDLSLHEMERGRGHASARLEIDLAAADDLDGIELALSLPEALAIADGTELPRGALSLRKGLRRQFHLSVQGPVDRSLPIHLKAFFRTKDGRTFTLQQGATFEPAGPPPAGRSNAGAYEVMAVPLEELSR